MGKFKIEINSLDNIEKLLQELYDEVCRNINEINTHINKINNATNLADEPIEMKAKFAKSINDFLQSKDKAIAKKIDIAKLLTEIAKRNGDVEGAIVSSIESKSAEACDWGAIVAELEKGASKQTPVSEEKEVVETYRL